MCNSWEKKEKSLPQIRILSQCIAVAAVIVGRLKKNESNFESAKKRKRGDIVVASIEVLVIQDKVGIHCTLCLSGKQVYNGNNGLVECYPPMAVDLSRIR